MPVSGVLANDSNPCHNPLTAELVTTASHGRLSFRADGSFSGTDVFTHRFSDGSEHSIATVVIRIRGTNPLHNFVEAHDVNGGSSISAADALTVINHLNSDYSISTAEAEAAGPSFVDVNDDGFVSALDAVMLINILNSKAPTGQVEAAERDVLIEASDLYDVSNAWTDGLLEIPHRRRLR